MDTFVPDQSGIKAIQVKRTLITADTAKQIILNWILLEGSESIVTNYILFTDNFYGNKDNIFDVTAENLYSEVLNVPAAGFFSSARIPAGRIFPPTTPPSWTWSVWINLIHWSGILWLYGSADCCSHIWS